MNQNAFTIRTAQPDDTAALAEIYEHHVQHGTATFETEAPDSAEMAARLAKVLAVCAPWLVAEDGNGMVIGYAYAAQFRDRPAYRFACENSVYIRHDRRGEGIGRALLALLIVEAERAGYRQMIAVIAGAQPASVKLHSACGFEAAGRMRGVGRKHGQWLDTYYMQRALGPGDSTPPEVEPL